jgi:hypothetical protein
MNAEAYRKILARHLSDALFESYYDVFADRMARPAVGGFYNGREAVAHYFVKKYGWTLEYCRSLKARDLETLLLGELDFLKIPADLQAVSDEAFEMIERFECPALEKSEHHPAHAASSRGSRKK